MFQTQHTQMSQEKYQILVSGLKFNYVRKPEKKHSIEINCIVYPLDKVNFKMFEKLNTLTSVEGSDPENFKLCEFNIYHQVGKTCISYYTFSLWVLLIFKNKKAVPPDVQRATRVDQCFVFWLRYLHRILQYLVLLWTHGTLLPRW